MGRRQGARRERVSIDICDRNDIIYGDRRMGFASGPKIGINAEMNLKVSGSQPKPTSLR
jgi:hypothetical protein